MASAKAEGDREGVGPLSPPRLENLFLNSKTRICLKSLEVAQ